MADTRELDVEGLLRWRCIGPFRGGRVVAVAGSSHEPHTYYFGAVAGGVWKTTDGGTYWQPVSDGFFTTSSVGALAVAPSDPNVIYAGTGETTIRIDVSHGDGVYRSTDAGRTWTHVGLARHPPHRQDPRPPAQPGHRVGGGAGSRLRPQCGARRVQERRRRRELAERALCQRQGRRGRPERRRDQPAHPLRHHLGGPSLLLADQQRRSGQRALAQ